jgi:hypothetical protein
MCLWVKKSARSQQTLGFSTNTEMKPTIMGIVIMENNDGQS